MAHMVQSDKRPIENFSPREPDAEAVAKLREMYRRFAVNGFFGTFSLTMDVKDGTVLSIREAHEARTFIRKNS